MICYSIFEKLIEKGKCEHSLVEETQGIEKGECSQDLLGFVVIGAIGTWKGFQIT